MANSGSARNLGSINLIEGKPLPIYRATALIGISLFISVVAFAQHNLYSIKKVITKFELTSGAGILANSGYFEDYMLPKYGYSVGAGATHSFNKSFDLTLLGLWELKGSKVRRGISEVTSSGDMINYSECFNTNFNYLTLELLPTFRIGHSKNIVAGAGGFYSKLKKVRVKDTKTDIATDITTSYTSYDLRNFYVKYDAGISIFVGYSFSFTKKKHGLVKLMYNKGLVDIHDGWNSSQRNNALLLVLSFNIMNSLGRK